MVTALVVMLAAGLSRSWRRAAVAAGVLVGAGGIGVGAEELVLPSYDVAFEPAVEAPYDPVVDVAAPVFRDAATVARPDWITYGLVDALIWGRDNQAVGPLVVTQDAPETAVLSASDPGFPFGGGVRAFYGQRAPDQAGWEIGYFGVYGQAASRSVAYDAETLDYLTMPLPIGPDLTSGGEEATFRYNSVINGAEANVFSTSTTWRPFSLSWLTVDWLAGFRYVGVEEDASLSILCCREDDTFTTVRYRARTRNNMFGGQMGLRSRWTWERWAFESWAKAGLLGNAQEQIQDPLVDVFGEEVRDARSGRDGAVSFIGDINLSAIYRLTDVWGIRAGYNLVWIDGLALAPNQFDFAASENAGTRVIDGGGIFMHGANLGLEARW